MGFTYNTFGFLYKMSHNNMNLIVALISLFPFASSLSVLWIGKNDTRSEVESKCHLRHLRKLLHLLQRPAGHGGGDGGLGRARV